MERFSFTPECTIDPQLLVSRARNLPIFKKIRRPITDRTLIEQARSMKEQSLLVCCEKSLPFAISSLFSCLIPLLKHRRRSVRVQKRQRLQQHFHDLPNNHARNVESQVLPTTAVTFSGHTPRTKVSSWQTKERSKTFITSTAT